MSTLRALNTFVGLIFLVLYSLIFGSQVFGQSANSQAAQSCVASGSSLGYAAHAYVQQCTLQARIDCDPINGVWYCASFNISPHNQTMVVSLSAVQSSLIQPVSGYNPGIENPGTENPGIENPAIDSQNVSVTTGIAKPAGDAPSPVVMPVIGISNGRPICLSDANDATGSGYGFEDNQSCIVVPGVTSTAEQPLLNQRICSPWFEISYGNYKLQNNTWNNTAVYSDNWSQCVELADGTGKYVAKWDYNWLKRSEGNEYAVKSYPQVYYGRKTQFNISGTVEQTGLPVAIDNMPQIRVEYDYSETGEAERNVALESFFHTSCDATENNKHYEMMVWVGVPAVRTPGVLLTTVALSGQDWDVYTNPSLGWGYVAFVANQPGNSGTLDWNAFVNWSRFNGPANGLPALAGNMCMGAIEFGAETFWGTGTFTLNRFNVVSAR